VAAPPHDAVPKGDRSRNFFGKFQLIDPFSSDIWIKPSLKALPIHLRKLGLFPLTTTGEHPSPNKGRIAFR
jgi:hypothetical protein